MNPQVENTDEDLLHSLFAESCEDEVQEALEDNPFFLNLQENQKRYSSHELIASGGMKNIYKVFDKKTGRHIALARLKDEIPVEAYEAFLLEARLTSLLEHPNIITVHDIGINHDGKPYFTMELKIGDSLKTIISSIQNQQGNYKEKFTLHELLTIFSKICDAVSYAHSRSVIHLDLKPGNIQIGSFGEVLVCDWGLGKVIGHSTFDNYEDLALNPDFLNDITLTGQIKGTLGFMAPEQAEKNGAKTPLCDIYALGAILYSLLSHHPPIEGSKDEMLKLTKLAEIEPLRHNSFGDNIPQSLAAVATKALSLDPKQRYQSAFEIRQEIDLFLKGFSTKAEQASLGKEFHLFIKRHAISCSLALAFLITALIGTSIFIRNLNTSVKNELHAREIAERESQKSRESQMIAERESQRSLEALAMAERARNRSKEAMLLFETQQQKAEKALSLYEKEKDSRNDYVRDLSKKFMVHIYKLTDVDVFTSPVQSLELALKTISQMEHDQKDAIPVIFLQQKGYIQFIMQNFADAAQCESSFPQVKAMAALCLDLPRENNLLRPQAFSEFFQLCSRVRYGHFAPHMASKMLAYDGSKRKNIKHHSQFVHELIKFRNHNWKNGLFEFDPKSKHLKISGKKLITIGAVYSDHRTGYKNVYFSYFSYLGLQSLDLSHSDFFKLDEIQNLKITKLDISHTLVTNLRPLAELARLQELVINYEQFPNKTLQNIPSHIKITFVK
ncbi:protein kinase [Lentisphaera profundi]|uniref:Protein kinase n=1 Tax=Lentisphaera profundi TaxID=1658616 RepID=A0ABY7VVC6_9BACT|nr:protein kinase [Lentisphaera profundi]WDE98178.1 protein kinase [Lentisphaera profundi]